MTRVAVFRPNDDRLETAVGYLESLGVDPVADPLLAVDATGTRPRSDAEFVVFTSKTAAGLLDDWSPERATVCAIGPRTAAALRGAGIAVDLVPETYSSAGLVDALRPRVAGARVEVARSDHGSDTLITGLADAGAFVHETILYRLVRPPGAGETVELAVAGELDAVVFTSALTVEYFLEAAVEREVRAEAIAALNGLVVGAIGPPTRDTARSMGICVDIVPEEATFEALADRVVSRLRSADSI